MKHMILPTAVAVTLIALRACGAATASAIEFEASEEGTLSGQATSSQTFGVEAGGPNATCEGYSSEGHFTGTKQPTLLMVVHYEHCTESGLPATASPVDIIYHADGKFDIENPYTITVSGLCTITYPAQSGLSAVTYSQSGKNLLVEADVTNVESTVSEGEGLCGIEGEHSGGSMTGNSELELDSGAGTLQVA